MESERVEQKEKSTRQTNKTRIEFRYPSSVVPIGIHYDDNKL